MNRYAEGTGTAAKFNDILDIKFLSSTTLICSDLNNHCLRLLNLTGTMAETSTYAGTCTTDGTTDGHRLHSALFRNQKYIEINNYSSTIHVFVFDGPKSLRKINLETDEVTTIARFGTYMRSMEQSGDQLLYFSSDKKIVEFDFNSEEPKDVAGSASKGKTTGSFDLTQFNNARGLLLLSHEGRTVLLVADKGNNR